ncbi:unnamed protein product, partial [Brugia timori]|uniref:DUF5600 domain-containing protein n=1 Tax=Brugia timori TaxID=42155 RepID=A0A0R3R4E7_9BILA
ITSNSDINFYILFYIEFLFSGGLGDDFQEIIGKFKNGIKLSIRGDPIMPVWGLCDTVIGRLAMNDDELKANIAAVIEALCKHRNPALGPFINRALIMVIPGDAHFALDVNPFLPIPTEQEIEKIGKRMKKKKKGLESAKSDNSEALSSSAEAQ